MFTTQKPQRITIEDGTYEAIIETVAEKVNQNNKRYIEVACRIRDGQPHARTLVYRKIWAAKMPSKDDLAVGGYLSWQVYEMADAASVPEGKQFASLDELFREVEGRPVLVTVENSEYNGRSYPGVIGVSASGTPLADDERRMIAAAAEQNRRAREFARSQKAAAVPTAPRYETHAYTPTPASAQSVPVSQAAQTRMTPSFIPLEDDLDNVPF